ncbi:uncharacterized protein FTJAE_5229 [Fusarium tjaetaba]|uniref:Uncharacterized protein n=1 Tax=Fusarium tjaetaba TaxID=1567544 RepID=A0A8H5VWW8_9HYPO|nr:uncharacterized protein FTJAE_5229 [Fusarium tjaetaba]KAF5638566.1 hypothetical protein FTJAE_5229 [Fusarium tjaetaba]
MMPRASAPELRPRAPCPLHPQPERQGDQISNSPPGFNGLDVQAQLCNLKLAYNLLSLPQKPVAVIKMMLQSSEHDENVAPVFAFQPEPQVLHAGYDVHRKSTSSHPQIKIAT